MMALSLIDSFSESTEDPAVAAKMAANREHVSIALFIPCRFFVLFKT